MKVHQLYIYPIKSMRGVSLPSAELTPQGFSHDRRFMLLRDHGDATKAPKGERYENLHVAYHPQLCLFTTALSFSDPNDPTDGEIEVTYTNPEDKSTQTLLIPLKPDASQLTPIDINMHQSRIKALGMPESYCDWFSSIFGFPVVLTWLGSRYRTVLGNLAPNAAIRNPILRKKHEEKIATPTKSPISPSWLSSFANRMPGLPTIFSPGNEDDDNSTDTASNSEDYTITFADCSPYLITSTTSLANVSSRLPDGQEMDITKFRPNIIVSGAAEAYEEDFWRELTISSSDHDDVTFLLTSNCVRCSSINVDYNTGKFGTGEEGQVLKKLQSDRRVDAGHKYGPVFGRYGFLKRQDAEAETQRGGEAERARWVLRVGDEVEASKRSAERTVFRWPGIGQTPKTDLYPV